MEFHCVGTSESRQTVEGEVKNGLPLPQALTGRGVTAAVVDWELIRITPTSPVRSSTAEQDF